MIDITFSVALTGGLISFLSPCVLPLVPPYLSYMAGTSLGEARDGQDGVAVTARTITAALLFVAGFTTVFVLLGATASVAGQMLRHYLEVLRWVAAIAIIIMGLHFLGVFRIAFLYREARVEVAKPKGLFGAYIMGLAFAFGWTPCLGPILAAILAVAGSEADVTRGMILLAIYSAGLGIPFILAAAALGPFAVLMKRMRGALGVIEKIMGAFLVLTGLGFAFGWLGLFANWIIETFPGLSTLG